MDIPVFVEPTADGFRATSSVFGNVTAEGKTEADALAGVRAQIMARLQAGANVLNLRVPNDPARAEFETATAHRQRVEVDARCARILEAAAATAAYPDVLDMVDEIVAENRRAEDLTASRESGETTSRPPVPEVVTP